MAITMEDYLNGKEKIGSTVRVNCQNCGGAARNHKILAHEQKVKDDGYVGECTEYQICQCLGCEGLHFREVYTCSEDCDSEGNPIEFVRVFPETREWRRTPDPELVSIQNVGHIYREAIGAFNANANVLAGAGLRAVVEAICIDRGVKGPNLETRIDSLVSANLLAKPQADLLHEERFLGNSALHELEAPAETDLNHGFEIVEGLLKTIYILPDRADKLRKGRIRRNKSQTAR